MISAETEKKYALDLDIEEWAALLSEMGQKPFRAGQIVQWLWQKHVCDADDMTNLPKALRDELKERVDFQLPVLVKEQRSSDGTRKYLWQLRDGQTVESVLMKHGDRLTGCVSTQVGCPLQCVYCATGLSGYTRSLSAGEIAAQFLAMEKAAGRDVGNVVYMGMGEPFLNTENVLKSVRMLSDEKMRNLGIRHFTISTSGVLPGVIALANSGLGVRLAISLHAADDELRGQLMPINQKYPLAELRGAMEEYQRITGNRITIEYALFGGVNDSVERARELVRYLKGIHVFINLIPFNMVDERFEKPEAETVLKFRKVLETAGFEVEIRREYGADIDAACGQLRRKTMSGEPCRLDSKPGFKPGAESGAAKPKKTAGRQAAKTGGSAAQAGKRQTAGGGAGEGRKRREPSGGFTEQRGGRGKHTPDDGRGRAKSGEKPGAAEPKKTARDGGSTAQAGKRQTAGGGGEGRKRREPSGGFTEERARRGKHTPDDERGRAKSGEKPGAAEPKKTARDGGSTAQAGKRQGKTTGGGKRPFEKESGEAKRRKTDQPAKERYRSGKMKEERPSHKEKRDESTPERGGKWYESATQPRRPRSKKPSPPGAKKTSMTGARKKSKTTPRRTAKKRK